MKDVDCDPKFKSKSKSMNVNNNKDLDISTLMCKHWFQTHGWQVDKRQHKPTYRTKQQRATLMNKIHNVLILNYRPIQTETLT